MKIYAFILGRNPELSVEELVLVLAPLGQIVEATRTFLLFHGSIHPGTLLARLGGTIKIVEIYHSVESFDEITQERWLGMLRRELTGATGRFDFGASLYGASAKHISRLRAIGLSLKKRVRQLSLRSRFVFNTEGVLSSVAVVKNDLVGRELVVLSGAVWHIGLTVAVQNYDLYSRRDYGRPERNARRGMLPPKLAQIMVNLSGVDRAGRLLDPFCGGGTILQEALLMGVADAWGVDRDPAAITEAQRNAEWLAERFKVGRPHLQQGDAAHLGEIFERAFFDAVATEPYLGPARLLKKRSLTRSEFGAVRDELAVLYMRFFEELGPILRPRARAVVVLPIFQLFQEKFYVCDFDAIRRLGWEAVAPSYGRYIEARSASERGQLVYTRPDQVVAREITVWRRR